MIKNFSVIFCLLLGILLFSGCDTHISANKDKFPAGAEIETSSAPGSDILTGMWAVSAVYANNRVIDLRDSPAMADLYDSTYLTFNADGMFYYTNLYTHEGIYELLETDDGSTAFLLRTSRTYRYQFKNGKVSEVDADGNNSTFLVLFTDSDTFEFREYDPITGTGKADDEPLYFVRSEDAENNT